MKQTKIIILAFFILLLALPGMAGASEPEQKLEGGESTSIIIPLVLHEPDSGLMFGVIYMKQSPGLQGNLFYGGLTYTQEDQLACNFGMDYYLSGGKYLFRSEFGYADWPSDFFGIGNEHPPETGEEYTTIANQLNIGLLRKLREGLYLGPTISCNWFEVNDKISGGQLAQGNINGRDGADAIGVGFQLLHNRLDDNNSPRQGYVYDIVFNSYQEPFGSSHDFSQLDASFAKFYALKRRGVIGINSQIMLSDGDVPFQMLPSLGSSQIMRGIEPNRYCDENLFAIQGEYRFPIYRRWSGVSFVALGDVADSLNSLKLDHYTLGIGIRYAVDEAQTLKLRLDIGCGQDESAAYFGLQEAF